MNGFNGASLTTTLNTLAAKLRRNIKNASATSFTGASISTQVVPTGVYDDAVEVLNEAIRASHSSAATSNGPMDDATPLVDAQINLCRARAEKLGPNANVLELECYLKAAQLYFDAEEEKAILNVPTLDDCLSRALLCSLFAVQIAVVRGNLTTAISICAAAGQRLSSVFRCHELAADYYEVGVLLLAQRPELIASTHRELLVMSCFECVMQCILVGDLPRALFHCQMSCGSPESLGIAVPQPQDSRPSESSPAADRDPERSSFAASSFAEVETGGAPLYRVPSGLRRMQCTSVSNSFALTQQGSDEGDGTRVVTKSPYLALVELLVKMTMKLPAVELQEALLELKAVGNGPTVNRPKRLEGVVPPELVWLAEMLVDAYESRATALIEHLCRVEAPKFVSRREIVVLFNRVATACTKAPFTS